MPDLVVQANVKDRLEDMNVAADFYDALDEEVDGLLERAAQRAQDNLPGRGTFEARLGQHLDR